jgi:V/A-type H+-transporting ATPase subunit A
VKKLYSIIKKPLPVPKLLRGARRGNEVSIPIKVTPELAELLGLFIAEGNIRDEGTIVFTNSETELLERFSELCELIFGIRGKIIKQETRTPYVLINSRVLVKFLRSINASGPAAEKQIPGVILRSSDKVLASFLRGYYLGDGSFYKGELELSTSSDHLHIGLSYLLTRLGILHILARKEDRRYRIFIRGLKNLEIFYRRVGNDDDLGKIKSISQYINSKATTYTSHDVVPLSREVIEELYRSSGISYTELKKEGIEISNYITNGEHMSATTFQKFASLISSNGRDRVQRLASLLDHIYCDKIVSIEEIEGPMDVFDVSVPGLENFVGGFGGTILHNTVVQHQLARWSDADVIIFVGCGERGNEMSQVLLEFPELTDPKTGRPLMERTILVANTSNMPFAAREASIYTGITMAEYYRDMGYDVAIQADSTSRWAEALREISGRLEEMPGEEGYPAYLASRIAAFYERSGVVKTLGGYEGSITVIGSVSPPGGDFSEPVTQSTLRFTKVFWALDAQLAYMRHFPAVSWLNSYSLYVDDVKGWWEENVSDEWRDLRERAMALLQRESELQEIVSLIGTESLSDDEKLILEVSKHIREDFLYQSAFHEIDTFTDTMKQYRLLRTIMLFYDLAQKRIGDMGLEAILELPFRLKIARAKYVTDMGELDRIDEEIKSSMGGEDG